MKTIVRLIVCLYLCFAVLLTLKAQTFHSKEWKNLKHGMNGSSVDAIFEKSAEGNKQQLTSLDIVIAFENKITVKQQANSTDIDIEITPIKIDGATQYKGFDMTNYFRPASLSFDLVVKKKNGKSQVLKEFKHISDNQKNIYTASYSWKNAKKEDIQRLELESFTASYADKNRREFVNKAKIIDEYYSQTKEISQYHDLLTNMDFKNPDEIERNNEKVKKLDTHLTNFRGFFKKLNLKQNDPLDFNKTYESLQETHQIFKTAYQEAKKNIHVLYYQEGIKLQNEGKVSRAAYYFNQALLRKEDYTPPLYQLARHNYLKGNFEEAEAKLDKIWKLDPQNVPIQKQSAALYEDLYYFHRSNGDKKMKNLNFEKAQKEFKKAEKICNKNVFSGSCQEEIKERHEKLIKNQFEYSVAEARNQVYIKGFRKANKALKKAIELMKAHPSIVGDQTEMLQTTYQELYKVCIDDAKQRVDSENYHVAVEGLRFAELIKEQNPKLNTISGDSLEHIYAKAFNGNYHLTLNEAEEMKKIGELIVSRDLLLQAFADETRYKKWIKNPQTDRIGAMLNTLYRDFIERANKENEAKNYQKALEDLRYAFNLSNEFSMITKDNEIGKGFHHAYMSLGRQALVKKDFQTALDYFQIANTEIDSSSFNGKTELVSESKQAKTQTLEKWASTLITSGISAKNANKINEARQIFRELKTLLQTHKFTLEKGLQKKYENLTNSFD